MPNPLSDFQKHEIIKSRENRMKRALTNIDIQILNTLEELKNREIKICLISNADIIDCKFWSQSPLSKYFDDAVFSCNIGLLKPDTRIYEYAMKKLKVSPTESLFVGDGGSSELEGAKKAGMNTLLTEYLVVKSSDKREKIMHSADYCVKEFKKIINITVK